MTPPVLALPSAVGPEEAERLGDDVRVLLESGGAGVVVCDVAALETPGLAAVDLLARLQLGALRAGGRLRLRGTAPALRALLGLVGLPIELEGQAEQREPARRIQEAVEPVDPAV
ncbi:STAS domain-containing protein [Streptomyces sp. NPDC047022]|uniref:STAS domain-containing protein n=1 Tax=Streptomyces sp. NPDC047022 TaxID=3155737 RepID=UPI003408ED8F